MNKTCEICQCKVPPNNLMWERHVNGRKHQERKKFYEENVISDESESSEEPKDEKLEAFLQRRRNKKNHLDKKNHIDKNIIKDENKYELNSFSKLTKREKKRAKREKKQVKKLEKYQARRNIQLAKISTTIDHNLIDQNNDYIINGKKLRGKEYARIKRAEIFADENLYFLPEGEEFDPYAF